MPANGRGEKSDPGGNQPGENDRPKTEEPPSGGRSPWPGNPWYGGVNVDGQQAGGPPSDANPKPSATNPNPSDNIEDTPTVPRGLYFITQLVCVDTGDIVWQYSWNNARPNGDAGPISGAPSPVTGTGVQ